jgi:hypothetical protein
MSEQKLFSPRLLALWVVLASLAFSLSIWFGFSGDSDSIVDPSTYSRSAIGHAGIAAILERLHIPVIRSKADSLRQAQDRTLLVLAEPDDAALTDGKLDQLLAAEVILVVLPKWHGQPDPTHAGWIASAERVGAAAATTLRHVDALAKLVPPLSVTSWDTDKLGAAPVLDETVQLVKSPAMTPIVATEAGILLGEIDDGERKIWVLSDPDAIANHGIAAGNGDFAVALFQELRDGGAIVFDETIHGFAAAPPNPLYLLVDKRFAATTIEAVAALALLFWATLGRFGAAEPAPAIEGDKQGVIRNMAALMTYAGHQRLLIRRYVEAIQRNTALRLGGLGPTGLDGAALSAWLDRRSAARGVSVELPVVIERADRLGAARRQDLPALLGIARDIDRWKREMLDGD